MISVLIELASSQDSDEPADSHSLISHTNIDWHQSLKQFFINVPYHILVGSLTLMALF